MRLTPAAFLGATLLTCVVAAHSQEKTRPKTPDGVYAVLRQGTKPADIEPIAAGEAMVVQRFRFVKKDGNEPPRYLAVRNAPDVKLDLAEAPKTEKENGKVSAIFLTLRPDAAKALARLTTDRLGKEVAIVVGGEVATMHKIRTPITGGQAQITSCAEGGADFLLQQLQMHVTPK